MPRLLLAFALLVGASACQDSRPGAGESETVRPDIMEVTKSLPPRSQLFIDWDDPLDSTYIGSRWEVDGETTYSLDVANLGIEIWLNGEPRSIAAGGL